MRAYRGFESHPLRQIYIALFGLTSKLQAIWRLPVKKTLLLSLLLSLVTTQAYAEGSLKIAITGPFSGGSAPMGISMRDGAKLAIAEINAGGGIKVGSKKLKIEIIERDDEGKNDRGALIAQEMASMENLSGVIGTVNTGVAMAGDRHLQEKGITKIITPAAGSASWAPSPRTRARTFSWRRSVGW